MTTTADGHELLGTFPAYFKNQASTGDDGGIEVKFGIPREGRDEGMKLLDTHGEILRIVVLRAVSPPMPDLSGLSDPDDE